MPVAQMQVKHIQFRHGHRVNCATDLRRRDPVPCDVEQQPPMAESRRVVNVHRGPAHRIIIHRGLEADELCQSFQPVQQAREGLRRDGARR